MTKFNRLYKIVLGASTLTGSWYLFNRCVDGKSAINSSTTDYEHSIKKKYNYTPSRYWDDDWDRRTPASLGNSKILQAAEYENNANKKLKSVTTRAQRHIIMIRHGQYNMNAEIEDFQDLTKLGILQAQFTGKRLKELGYPYTSMIKSTLTRSRQTGDIINKIMGIELPTENCHLIREGAPIPPEPQIEHWRPPAKMFYEDGPRIEEAFRKYFYRTDGTQKQDSYTILVCHANVIRYFTCRALQFPPEAWARFSLDHGSITWVTITPEGRVTLKMLGDSGHIPANLISS